MTNNSSATELNGSRNTNQECPAGGATWTAARYVEGPPCCPRPTSTKLAVLGTRTPPPTPYGICYSRGLSATTLIFLFLMLI